MNKTEKLTVRKWLDYIQYQMMQEMIQIQDRCAFHPSGTNRMDRNNMRIILNFIEYQRSILEE